MNKNFFLAGAACLLISNTVSSEVKIIYDSEQEPRIYSTEEEAIATYGASCRMHTDFPTMYPEQPKAATIIDENTGKTTPIDCSTVRQLVDANNANKLQEAKAQEAAKAEKLREEKLKIGASWGIQIQQKDGSWRASPYQMMTKDDARKMANIECLRNKYPLKIVDTVTNEEHTLLCDPKRGKVTAVDGVSLPVILLTEAEASKRAEEIKGQCQGNYFMSSVLDCDCIENKAKDELLQNEPSVALSTILSKVTNPPDKACVNREGAYKYVYDVCVSVIRRPNDLEEFCHCSADTTASNFVKDPIFNLYRFDRLRDAAFKQCGLGKKAG